MAKAVVMQRLISIGLVGALCALTGPAVGGSFVVAGSQAASEKSCVAPTDYMRRNHMELIKHQRDATVHLGIRATEHTLAGCIACHASVGPDGKAAPVNEKGQFCYTCHDFAAVRVNCFDCHATAPQAAKGQPIGHGGGVHPGLSGHGKETASLGRGGE